MIINKTLLKYGYSKFTLQILEYCDTNLVLDREQYYMDTLSPEYNILSKAGSNAGYKHSEATLAKLRRKFSPEHLAKILIHLKKLNSKPFSPEIRAKISKGTADFNVRTKGKKVLFIDLESKETLNFSSMREAALNMKIGRNTIKKHILSQEPYLGKYLISII